VYERIAVALEGSAEAEQILPHVQALAERFGSTLVRLRRGVRRAPDAAWISNERLASVPTEQRQGVLPIPPDFAVELRSPTDSVDELKDKMRTYIQAGVQLAWLIDPISRTVYEYRSSALPREYRDPRTMSAEPVLAGFVLDLAEVWQAQ
jgi:Uma2 family endonuclease